MLVRGAGLAATMSDYLVQRIERSAADHACTRIPRSRRSTATTSLRSVTWTNRTSGEPDDAPGVAAIFVMIGAEPNTDWLGGCLELDAQGFVVHRRRRRADARFALCDLAAGRLRRRRRPLGLGQARRLGRRRRLGRGPGDPPLPEPGAGVTGRGGGP